MCGESSPPWPAISKRGTEFSKFIHMEILSKLMFVQSLVPLEGHVTGPGRDQGSPQSHPFPPHGDECGSSFRDLLSVTSYQERCLPLIPFTPNSAHLLLKKKKRHPLQKQHHLTTHVDIHQRLPRGPLKVWQRMGKCPRVIIHQHLFIRKDLDQARHLQQPDLGGFLCAPSFFTQWRVRRDLSILHR